MAAALAGLRILDLSRGPAGGVATMVLADFGAEVLKIEPPGGDPFRRLAAAPMWLRGKQSLELDLKTEVGVTRLHSLVPSADILIAGYRPGVAEQLGADFATCAALNPGLIYCNITGFGSRGPYSGYKGYEGIVAAKSGRMANFSGQLPRPGPIYAAVQVATHGTAQAVVQAVIAALLVRAQTGTGQLLETSLLQGLIPFEYAGLIQQQVTRRFADRYPAMVVGPHTQPTLQYQPVLTADGGWLQLANLMEHLFHSYLAAAELTHIYADPRFAGVPALGEEEKEQLRDIMLTRMRERTIDEWQAAFIADGNVASEPIVSTQDALRHPQMVHNGHVRELEHPRLGHMLQIGPIATLPETPACIAAASPAVGEHTSTFDTPPGERPSNAPMPAAERRPRHPLEGVTVVEFGTIIATPYAGVLLSDLGARVIKVEPPEGDGLRGMALGAVKTTTGKESICLDLKSEAGRRIARQLIERADILTHNFRPGVPERLGIGYEDVRGYNPRIVYISATGYGADGPYARRPLAHPAAGAALGGVLWQTGSGMPPAPPDAIEDVREYARQFSRANEVNPDPNTALVIASAALIGLYVQRTRGIGQHVQTDMLIGNAYANLDDFLAYEGKPERPLVDPELHGLHALYRLYPAAEGWVFLACPFDHEWQALCRALDRADLATDPRFTSAVARRDHDAALIAELSRVFVARPAAEWEALLTARDIGCVQADAGTTGVFWDSDEHVLRNGFVAEAEHLRFGPYWRHGAMVQFADTPGRLGAAVLAGQHTTQLLRELGYDPDEIAALRATGVVRSEEP